MTQTIAEAWMEEGEARGEAKGEIKGQFSASRVILTRVLTRKFGSLPETLIQRIEAAADLERLQSCIEQVNDLPSLTQLEL